MWTSPAWSVRSTPSSATTPGNALHTPRISSTGAGALAVTGSSPRSGAPPAGITWFPRQVTQRRSGDELIVEHEELGEAGQAHGRGGQRRLPFGRRPLVGQRPDAADVGRRVSPAAAGSRPGNIRRGRCGAGGRPGRMESRCLAPRRQTRSRRCRLRRRPRCRRSGADPGSVCFRAAHPRRSCPRVPAPAP